MIKTWKIKRSKPVFSDPSDPDWTEWITLHLHCLHGWKIQWDMRFTVDGIDACSFDIEHLPPGSDFIREEGAWAIDDQEIRKLAASLASGELRSIEADREVCRILTQTLTAFDGKSGSDRICDLLRDFVAACAAQEGTDNAGIQ